MDDNKTYEQAAKDALANFGKESKPVEPKSVEPKSVEVNPAEVKKEVIPAIEIKKEEVKKEEVKTPEGETPKVLTEVSSDKMLEELNKLGFKVKGKNKAISSTEELKRLINLGFNYEENARKLNEERQKLKQIQDQPKKEDETFPDYDEKQKEIEARVKAIDEYISNVASKETEKELDEAIAILKEEFPSITEEELDAINLELQNRLDLIPQGKEIDVKSLMQSIYHEFNPDAFNKKMQMDIDKKVQEKLDDYKNSLSKAIVTEGGVSPAVKSGGKTPSSYEEGFKLAMEDEELFKK